MGAASETSSSGFSGRITASRTEISRGVLLPAAIESRIAVILTVALVALALFAAGYNLTQATNWNAQPFLGALLTRTLMVDGSQSVTGTPWAALAEGMRRGDQIIAINDTSLGRQGDFATILRSFDTLSSAWRTGQRVDIGFLRESSAARQAPELCAPVIANPDRCDVTVILGSFPALDFGAFFILPWATGVIVVIIAAIVLVMRPHQTLARTVSVCLALLSIFLTGFFSINSTYTFAPVWIIATSILGGMFISLAFIFPTRSSIAYRQPLLRYLPIILFAIVGGVLAWVFGELPSVDSASTVTLTAAGVALLGLILLVAALVVRRRRASTAFARDQIQAVLIGIVISFIVAGIWVLNLVSRAVTGTEVIGLNNAAATPIFLIPAISLAYATLQYRTFNTDRVISSGITYLSLLIALVIGYFLLVFGASLLTQSVVGANNLVIVAVVIFIMAVLFVPARARVQALTDRVYFRQRVNYQQRVENFARALSNTSDLEPALSSYDALIRDALEPDGVYVFLPEAVTGDFVAHGQQATDVRFARSSSLVQHLLESDEPLVYFEPGKPWNPAVLPEKARLHILKAMVIAPLRGTGRLNGFAIIGPPLSGAGRYNYEELRFLESLGAQMTVSVERAQVVESLQRRVRELDVLGQVSQAVNFTLEFDDLLELISTQADKLVEANHFYIVLREGEQEMAYAFFLEGDERARDKENVSRPLGRDLYSEVILSGQPMRVANYAKEAADRGLTDVYESPSLRAWMGVPLIAGSTVLGVMAVGTLQPNRLYTDEQQKIFTDIAALAATALERARLFRETTTRARQLAALNDISRQIVASEVNLEGLLKIITASAVEILDAEAGSLLLTADDNSGDLVFRVAIGGSGEDIIGVRVPARRGLVGEVASTGQAVIVPDVATDARWGGELGKGPFQTRSVIAVPLVSQNRVIGVLEVLNKRGSGFTEQDADLLNTFAGQAAVGIENARLFELTDQQLSMRVSELETLERIDVELNRSLDLAKVARITVEWALENSSATAAMIGIVHQNPDRLEIIYSEGYESQDLPEGSVGRMLPLDRGIVSRVLRTRQPELVTDVRMDRDYVPSLRGALSQITIPMLSGRTVNAMLILESNREPRLRLADMPFLQRLTEHASIAITNAQLYAELERANQSKSEFVSFVAHELKNPLTSIRGYSDFLLGGQTGGLSSTQQNFIQTIRTNAERMNTLVSDLNDVTKLQTNNMRIDPQPISFRTVIEETLRPFQKQIEDRGQVVTVDAPADLPQVMGDEGRLIQVMTNLVSNATKYTPDGGKIHIQAHVVDDARDSSGRPLPARLVVRVSDTGIGMSSEDLGQLFTPYFRSENPLAQAQPGTGLGMTITRGIVEAHGGEIAVESALGEGTTFAFTVPLVAAVTTDG
jgi:signal transduction histidine kinase